MSPPPTSSACVAWRHRLAKAESAMADRRAHEMQAPDMQAHATEMQAVDLRSLRAHLASCATCTRSHGARLSALEAQMALRSRSVPDGLFDGFYERLENEARMAPLGGGMSLAFLDAPRALHAWRLTALTAGLLLVAGVAWVATREAGPRESVGRPHGADAFLTAWPDATKPDERHDVQIRPAQSWGNASERLDSFYQDRRRATPASVVVPPRAVRSDSSDLRRD